MAKVMITIPDDFLKEIDAVAKAEHRTRSELFRELARKYINNQRQFSQFRMNPTISEQDKGSALNAFNHLRNANISWKAGTSEEYIRELRDKTAR